MEKLEINKNEEFEKIEKKDDFKSMFSKNFNAVF